MERLANGKGFRVLGRVQGVGFRWSATQRARSLELRGSIRNRRDGSVEVRVAGTSEAVARFASWLEEGPPSARVERVEEMDSRLPLPEDGFRIVR